MPDNNFLPNVIGGLIALKVVESLDKPKKQTVTKVVYVKNGKTVKVIKKDSHPVEHGPFYLDVPKFPKGIL